MGNPYEAEFAADVDETTNTRVAPAPPVGASSPERSAAPSVDIGLFRPPFGRETKEGGAGGRLSLRSSSRPQASRPVRSALTWLATFAMEGFAAYGQAMYPCFSDPGTLTDVHAGEQNAQPRQQWQKHSGQSFTNPWMLEETRRSAVRSVAVRALGTMSRTARVWSDVRKSRPTHAALETLDEHGLEDIGTRRYPIERIERAKDRYWW
jgi:uncharacterized protein YjiS (DUF1127 family)